VNVEEYLDQASDHITTTEANGAARPIELATAKALVALVDTLDRIKDVIEDIVYDSDGLLRERWQ
jgi:hypothetical protein